jgi:hypothetical protein
MDFLGFLSVGVFSFLGRDRLKLHCGTWIYPLSVICSCAGACTTFDRLEVVGI